MAVMYRKMGQVDKAIQKYEESLNMKYKVYETGSCNERIARALCNLGNINNDRHEYEEADRDNNQAYDMMVKVCEDGRQRSLMADILHNMEKNYKALGQSEATIHN